MKLVLDSTEKEKSEMHTLSDQLAEAEMKLVRITKQFEDDKEQLTKSFEVKTEALISEHRKEMEARQPTNPPHKDETEEEIQSELTTTVQSIPEIDSSQTKVTTASPQRKLSHNEVKAFRQRLAASDNRAIAAEAKRSEVEHELEKQLSEQRQSFKKELDDIRDQMMQSEEAMSAMKQSEKALSAMQSGTTSDSEEKIRRLSQENNDLRCQLTCIWTCINEQSSFVGKEKLPAQTDGEVIYTHPKIVGNLQEVPPTASREVQKVVGASPMRARLDTPPRAVVVPGPVICRTSGRISRHEVCVASPRRRSWQVAYRSTSRHVDM